MLAREALDMALEGNGSHRGASTRVSVGVRDRRVRVR